MSKRLIIEIGVMCLVAIISYRIGCFQSSIDQKSEFSILRKVIETEDIESYESIMNDFDEKEAIFVFPKDSLSNDRKFAFSFLMASLNDYPKAYGDACLYINKRKYPDLQKKIAEIGAEKNDTYCLKKLAFLLEKESDTCYIKTYEHYLYYLNKDIIENIDEKKQLGAIVSRVQNNLGIGFNYYYKYEFNGKSYESKDWSQTSIIKEGDSINVYVNPDRPEECISSKMLNILREIK